MSVIKTITTGLYNAQRCEDHRKLEVAALRFSIRKLLATGEALNSACILLEQMAQEIEADIVV